MRADSTLNLTTIYARALADCGYERDDAQLRAINALDRVGHALQSAAGQQRRWPAWLGRAKDQAPVQGAYLWGGVGRGKTFAMDLFFEALPGDRKLRYHFHRLMYRVHRRRKELTEQTDPIDMIAAELAEQAQVICFDEFFVSDIADAMILGRLLEGLFNRGVCLVATSNIPPDELYRDGLQRQQFLPAIDLINRHTEVLNIDGGTDYRLRVLEQAKIYHSPLNDDAEGSLARSFEQLAPDAGTRDGAIEVLGRDIPVRARADGIAWFEFSALCDGPRSQDDYIDIAQTFGTILLANIPLLDQERENSARRFIALVDEFYDRRVNLIVSAAAQINGLYQGTRLKHEFERTESRLREMQSQDYLSQPHRP